MTPSRRECAVCSAPNVPHRLDGAPFTSHVRGARHTQAVAKRRDFARRVFSPGVMAFFGAFLGASLREKA